jgi:zinc D-Ala-D-Ala carboxypeptidase
MSIFDRWPNFTEKELTCQETGDCRIDVNFMDTIQAIRDEYGKPMNVTSGYRSPEHSIEARKEKPGEHADGLAVDVYIPTEDFLYVTYLAYKHGLRRIGWNPGSFIHLGGSKERPQTVWIYK